MRYTYIVRTHTPLPPCFAPVEPSLWDCPETDLDRWINQASKDLEAPFEN